MSIRTRKPLVLMALFLLGSALVSSAQAQLDYSGLWNLTTSSHLPDENTPCEFSGQATITQHGADLDGTANLMLVSGPAACPAEMTARVQGVVRGTNVELGLLLGGQWGEADFYSTEGENGGPAASLSGPFVVTKGPYSDQMGSWMAVMAASIPSLPVPTLAFYGVLVFVLMLVLIGGYRLRRRQIHS